MGGQKGAHRTGTLDLFGANFMALRGSFRLA
jgi:hypothetical protein